MSIYVLLCLLYARADDVYVYVYVAYVDAYSTVRLRLCLCLFDKYPRTTYAHGNHVNICA